MPNGPVALRSLGGRPTTKNPLRLLLTRPGIDPTAIGVDYRSMPGKPKRAEKAAKVDKTPQKTGGNKQGRKGSPRTPGAGRKKGTLNKVTKEVQEIAAKLLDNARYRKILKVRISEGTLHPTIERMLWNYAYGKPTENINLNASIGITMSAVVAGFHGNKVPDDE